MYLGYRRIAGYLGRKLRLIYMQVYRSEGRPRKLDWRCIGRTHFAPSKILLCKCIFALWMSKLHLFCTLGYSLELKLRKQNQMGMFRIFLESSWSQLCIRTFLLMGCKPRCFRKSKCMIWLRPDKLCQADICRRSFQFWKILESIRKCC